MFVKAAVSGVIREGVIAAALTGLMILLFLGSWRSTLIITVSIPLAVLSSVAMLSALGETINVMTLGGLALAIGILVDDATVTIENINWHLEQGKDVTPAILDGSKQIVTPALVSLLCICIVFVPMFFLDGVARYLFVPMAEAVVFALIASFVLSRTLVPTMAKYLLQPHVDPHSPTDHPIADADARRSDAAHVRRREFPVAFPARFRAPLRERARDLSRTARDWRWARRRAFLTGFAVVVLLSFVLAPWLGENFFPSIDSGQIKLHMRAQTGTRIEETARLATQVEKTIRRIIPADELKSIVDNIGLPVSGINITYSNSAPIGPADADILISLNDDHRPTDGLRREVARRAAAANFPARRSHSCRPTSSARSSISVCPRRSTSR